MLNKKTIIAIDGYSSCGKSTLAKDLAKSINIAYVDSGAMYRAVALYFIDNSLKFTDSSEVNIALAKINIHFDIIDGVNTTFLNNNNVEKEIRSPKVASIVSEVAAIPEVRTKLVALQREMGETNSLIMDGRDIGSNVFPNADFKFFITADPKVRAERRLLELRGKGIESSFEDVFNNLKHRDHIDTTRKTNPLIQTKDAIVIDNTELTKEAQLALILSIINK